MTLLLFVYTYTLLLPAVEAVTLVDTTEGGGFYGAHSPNLYIRMFVARECLNMMRFFF